MGLTTSDYRGLLETLDAVYGADQPEALLSSLLERIDFSIGISSAVFLPVGASSLRMTKADGLQVFDLNSKLAAEYVAHWAPMDPLVIDGRLDRPNRALRNTDVWNAVKLVNSAFATDFLSRVPCCWILGATVGTPGHLVGAIGLHRREGDPIFDDRHVAMFNAVLPHVSRALHFLEERRRSLLGGAIAIADGRNAIVYANEAASRALHDFDLRAALARCLAAPSAEQGATAEGEWGTIRISVQAISTEYRLVTMDPIGDAALRARLAFLGLTRRQQEIAVKMLAGLSNKKIATELNVTEQTVKEHIQGVFRKVGIQRRAELAARLSLLPK